MISVEYLIKINQTDHTTCRLNYFKIQFKLLFINHMNNEHLFFTKHFE